MLNTLYQKQSGLTIIELLVVITIIGILASVILSSLGSAREKASDAKVQAQLSSARSLAKSFYHDNGGDYTGSCAESDMIELIDVDDSGAVESAGVAEACLAGADDWAAEAALVDGSFWCVDSHGMAINTATSTLTAASSGDECSGSGGDCSCG